MADETSIAITEDIVRVTVAEEVTTIDITPTVTTVEAKGLAISLANAEALPFTPHGAITGTNVQAALQQLADQSFRGADAPTGSNIEQGDLWYETDTETLKIYREVSSNVFNWVPVAMGTGDSDTLDGGSY